MIEIRSNAQSATLSALVIANYLGDPHIPNLSRCFCVTRERQGLMKPYHRHGTLWSAQS